MYYKSKEIGSEFSYNPYNFNNKNIYIRENEKLIWTFSGRTALETIIKNETNMETVMLPSYCCDSMIEPFRDAGIKVSFYDVCYKDGLCTEINIESDIDAILWCNYFGFSIDMPDLNDFIKRGGFIIEDITHSMLSIKKYNKQSKYLVGSIRKWIPVFSGGVCVALNGTFTHIPQLYPKPEYLHMKKEAMNLKLKYLNGDKKISKTDFMHLFEECNRWLATNYSNMQIDSCSKEMIERLDWDMLYEHRRNNAKILYKGLKMCNNIKFLFDESQMNCPLFLPIVVGKENRSSLKKYLIENEIFCPIHWPKPKECKSNLYDIELSLICDQRYGEEDMLRMVDALRDWDRMVENRKKGN